MFLLDSFSFSSAALKSPVSACGPDQAWSQRHYTTHSSQHLAAGQWKKEDAEGFSNATEISIRSNQLNQPS